MTQQTQQFCRQTMSFGVRSRLIRASAVLVGLALVTATAWVSAAQAQTITISGTKTTTPFREYATRELGDPWDMSSRTDIGWFTWGVDSPPSNMTGIGLATDAKGNTAFKGQTSGSDSWFFLLDTWIPGTANLGKTGGNYPIDTTVYNRLYIRMKIGNDVLDANPLVQAIWSAHSIFGPASGGGSTGGQMRATALSSPGNPAGLFLTPQGSQPGMKVEGGNWVVYEIPLTIARMKQINPDIDRWKNFDNGVDADWGAAGVMADSLRISPINLPSSKIGEIQIDWARLVSYPASPSNSTTIAWTGGGTYDVVVSTQSDCSDFSVVGYSQASGYQFQSQILPPGTYHVGLRKPFQSAGHTAPTGSTLQSCSGSNPSTQTFTVQSYPSVSITTPNVEGSTDDFATNQLGNAWDFDSLLDIDFSQNANTPDGSYGIVTRAATDPAGNDLGNVRVYRNRSTAVTSGVGDPYAYLLWPIPEQAGSRTRGLHKRIDASRYRILTMDLGIERTRDLTAGSIARIIWHVDGELKADGNLAETESSDIMLRHLDPAAQNGSKIVLDTVQIDMADRASFPIETDYAQPGSGWKNACTPNPATNTTCDTTVRAYSPGVNLFRIDFHEFSPANDSYVRRVKLAALERTGNTYTIRWTPSNPSSLAATVDLKAVPVTDAAASNYRPSDRTCATGTLIASGQSLAAGSYVWTPTGLTNGAEYYVCAQTVVSGTVVDEEMSRWPVVIDTTYAGPKPMLRVDRSTLRFTGVRSGSTSPVFSSKTPPETVNLTQSGAGTVNWSVSVINDYGRPASWFSVSKTSGAGSSSFTVSLNDEASFPTCTAVDGLKAWIMVTSGDTGNDPQYIQVYGTIYSGAGGSGGCSVTSGATTGPIGMMDTPLQNTTGVVGSIGVTGWAVDDVGIASVKLYRRWLPEANEPAANYSPAARGLDWNGVHLVYMGVADMVPGARPDVEGAYPTYPQASRAGWGYLLLTNMLPHIPNKVMYGGQGSIDIYVIATDAEGNRRLLGRGMDDETPTTITLTNDTSVKPFGAIDNPGQGQTVSGMVNNWGWALTPDAKTTEGGGIHIPNNGSTIWVWIDGAPVAHPTLNMCRSDKSSLSPTVPSLLYCDDDVSNIFGNPTPQPTFQTRTSNVSKYRNLDAGRGPIGVYTFDTTTMTNGRHSIVWGVNDSDGRADGVGSRDFIVLNGSGDTLASLIDAPARSLGKAAGVVALPTTDGDTVWGRSRFDPYAAWEVVDPIASGSRAVRIPELGRVELYLGAGTQTGYLVANGSLRPLPPGSQLREGDFTWAPIAGYIGDYHLVFLRDGRQTPVTVTIFPASQPGGIQAYIDDPIDDASIRGEFRVAGWAADSLAWTGSGIGAVHVWAHPRAGTSTMPHALAGPVFLGSAAVGGLRPDVAAVLGAQFDRTGWSVTAAPLPPGTYDVVAYFWSTRTTQFEDARTVTVTVR